MFEKLSLAQTLSYNEPILSLGAALAAGRETETTRNLIILIIVDTGSHSQLLAF